MNATTLAGACPEIKRKSFAMLTGVQYEDFKEKHRYVATFGDSDPAMTGDWVRVLYKNEPDYGAPETSQIEARKCPGLVTQLHIEVLTAKLGSFSNPQTKVVGVLYKFGKLTDQHFTCVGLACNHRWVSSHRILL